MQVEFNWKDSELVDFTVKNEDWQTYTLSDGSKLRVKLVLTQVWRSRNQVNPMTGEPLYMWNSQNLVALTSFPEQFRSQPTSIQITQDIIAQSIEQTVDFDIVGKQDEWSVYNLTDGSVLRLRMNVTGISRTKIRGQAGEPLYSVLSGPPNYRLKVAEKLIRKTKPTSMIPKSKSATYG